MHLLLGYQITRRHMVTTNFPGYFILKHLVIRLRALIVLKAILKPFLIRNYES